MRRASCRKNFTSSRFRFFFLPRFRKSCGDLFAFFYEHSRLGWRGYCTLRASKVLHNFDTIHCVCCVKDVWLCSHMNASILLYWLRFTRSFLYSNCSVFSLFYTFASRCVHHIHIIIVFVNYFLIIE